MATEITDYTARTAVEDVDCIEICPQYPDYMIYGTYSLVSAKEREYIGQIRTGTIHVLPVDFDAKPTFPGMILPKLAKKTFPAAVLDIHFHPNDPTLLGVALSNSEVHFLRFVKRGDILSRRVITELLPLGHLKIAEKDEYGLIPLVTQFSWFPTVQRVGRRDVNDELTVLFGATLSSRQVKVIKIRLPGIKSTHDHRLSRAAARLSSRQQEVHIHDLEAWTVTYVQTSPPTPDKFPCILLSGADDSKLLASSISINTCSHLEDLFDDDIEPTLAFQDTKSHNAGVTAILPLPFPASISEQTTIPFLTGSYDESLRLFLLSPTTHRRTLVTSLSLRGGVWRLKSMDSYTIINPSTITHPQSTSAASATQQHYLILVSCMHAGAKIIRVKHDTAKSDKENQGWEIEVEAEFMQGHETLVYACDFKKDWVDADVARIKDRIGQGGRTKNVVGKETRNGVDEKQMDKSDRTTFSKDVGGQEESRIGLYTVVSTSFYDRQICVWTWRDVMRKDGVSS